MDEEAEQLQKTIVQLRREKESLEERGGARGGEERQRRGSADADTAVDRAAESERDVDDGDDSRGGRERESEVEEAEQARGHSGRDNDNDNDIDDRDRDLGSEEGDLRQRESQPSQPKRRRPNERSDEADREVGEDDAASDTADLMEAE